MKLIFVTDLPPSVNRLWRVGRGGRMYLSPKYEQWRTVALYAIKSQMRGQQPIACSYKLSLDVVRPDRRRRDLDNLFKAISDALVLAGAIADDSLCEWLEARWVEAENPCTVTIEALNVKGRDIAADSSSGTGTEKPARSHRKSKKIDSEKRTNRERPENC